MGNLQEFYERYRKNVSEMIKELSYLDGLEVYRPFWESSLLPEDSELVLMLGETIPSKTREIIGILGMIALGKFLSAYMANLGTYFRKKLGLEISLEELFSKAEEAVLRKKLKKASLTDPIFSWFLSQGIEIISELMSCLALKDVDDLATLVSCLDYRAVFLITAEEEKESYSYLLDVLEGLRKDLAEASLLKEQRNWLDLLADNDWGEIPALSVTFGEQNKKQVGYREIKIRRREDAAAGEDNLGGSKNNRTSFEVA